MLRDIHIEKSEDTPEVILNPSLQIFSFTGCSMPEDSLAFYNPIINWFERYVQEPFEHLYVDIRLLYFNTASAKQLARMLAVLDDCEQREKITIRWFYDVHDIETIDTGKRYEVIPLKFEYYPFDFTVLAKKEDPEGKYYVI